LDVSKPGISLRWIKCLLYNECPEMLYNALKIFVLKIFVLKIFVLKIYIIS